MSKVKPSAKRIETLNDNEAFSILSEYVSQNCCLKSSRLKGLKIRGQTKKDCYSYHLVYLTKTVKENWEINFTEGTDSASNQKINFDNNLAPKEYFKDEIKNIIVPNSGIYTKCDRCIGTGLIANTKQTCKCGNQQEVNPNSTSFTCNKCTTVQNNETQKCSKCKNGQVRRILKVQVEFKNKYFDFLYKADQIPDEYFQKSKGVQIFYEENLNGRVNMLKNIFIPEIVEKSNKEIGQHENTIAQKHFIQQYPVLKYDFTYKEENFYIVGNELKVYAPNYPSRCCSIL